MTKKICLETFKKCPGSLCFTLLFNVISFCCSSFCCCSSFHLQAAFPCHRRSTLASQTREGLHQHWLCPDYFRLRFLFLLPWALRFYVGVFYPQAFFILRSFTDIFDSTCVYQGLPGSRQFFLEVCRASYWLLETQTRPMCLFDSQ